LFSEQSCSVVGTDEFSAWIGTVWRLMCGERRSGGRLEVCSRQQEPR